MESGELKECVTSKLDELKALLVDSSCSKEKVDSLELEVSRLKDCLQQSENLNKQLKCRLLKANLTLFDFLRIQAGLNNSYHEWECGSSNIQSTADSFCFKKRLPYEIWTTFPSKTLGKSKLLKDLGKTYQIHNKSHHCHDFFPIKKSTSLSSITCFKTQSRIKAKCSLKKSLSDWFSPQELDFCEDKRRKDGVANSNFQGEDFCLNREGKNDQGYFSGSKSSDNEDCNANCRGFSEIPAEFGIQGNLLGQSDENCEMKQYISDTRNTVSQSKAFKTVMESCSRVKETVENPSTLSILTSNSDLNDTKGKIIKMKKSNTYGVDEDTQETDGASILDQQLAAYEAKPPAEESINKKRHSFRNSSFRPSRDIPISSLEHEAVFNHLLDRPESGMAKSIYQTCQELSIDDRNAELVTHENIQDKDIAIENDVCLHLNSIKSVADFDRLANELVACKRDKHHLQQYMEKLLVSSAEKLFDRKKQRHSFLPSALDTDEHCQLCVQFSEDSSTRTLTSANQSSREGCQSSEGDEIQKLEKQIKELLEKLCEKQTQTTSSKAALGREKDKTYVLSERNSKLSKILEDERKRFARDMEKMTEKYGKAKAELKKLSSHRHNMKN